MNRREAIRVLAGTAVLLATVPAEATAIDGLKPFEPESPQKPDENWYTVKLGIEPGEAESEWVGHTKDAHVKVPASGLIDKAHEAIDAILAQCQRDNFTPDLKRNVEIRFTFAEPFVGYKETWEVLPTEIPRRGFLVHRALTLESSRVANEEVKTNYPDLPVSLLTEGVTVGASEGVALKRYSTHGLRKRVRETLREVEIKVWAVPHVRT
jgi:hypothetical protein